MKNDVTYKLSTDYDRLYELIQEGQEVVCWIDYTFDFENEIRIYRDTCSAKKHPNVTMFQSRGYGYICINRWDYEDLKMSELEYLKKICEKKNVEFFDPQNNN